MHALLAGIAALLFLSVNVGCVLKNRTPGTLSNNFKKYDPISIISGTDNHQSLIPILNYVNCEI